MRGHELLVGGMWLNIRIATSHVLRCPSSRRAVRRGRSGREVYLGLAWSALLRWLRSLLLLTRLHRITRRHASLVLLLDVKIGHQAVHSLRRGIARVGVVVSEQLLHVRKSLANLPTDQLQGPWLRQHSPYVPRGTGAPGW